MQNIQAINDMVINIYVFLEDQKGPQKHIDLWLWRGIKYESIIFFYYR